MAERKTDAPAPNPAASPDSNKTAAPGGQPKNPAPAQAPRPQGVMDGDKNHNPSTQAGLGGVIAANDDLSKPQTTIDSTTTTIHPHSTIHNRVEPTGEKHNKSKEKPALSNENFGAADQGMNQRDPDSEFGKQERHLHEDMKRKSGKSVGRPVPTEV